VSVKGFADLVEAFSRLNSPSLKLVILGTGSFRDDILSLAVHLGMADRALLPGFVPNPYPYFAAARAFVLPSHSEALLTVLVEATACKTPVGGRFGQLHPVGDVQNASCQIDRCSSRGARNRLRPRSRHWLDRAEEFTAERILPKLEQHIFEY